MLFIIVALIAILACIIINYFIRKFFSFEALNKLPGPVRLPLVGTSYIFLQQKSQDFLDIIMLICKKYSSPFQFWMGPQLIIVIYEPNEVQTVLKSRLCLDKSMVYKVLEPIFGSGIASAPAHIWTGHRKMIAPIFKTVNLRKFVDIFVEEASMLTEELEKVEHNENEIFFLKPLEKCALKIACGTMIGIKVEENILDKTVEAFERMKEIIRARFRNPFLIPDFIFNLTSMGKMQREILIFVQSFIDKMIQQWANESNTTNVNDSKAHKRLVDILMNSTDKEFIEKDIFYNLFTMLVTASDTTAVTMYFVIFMLANFPEIQEKVYKELLEIYGTQTPKAAPVKYEDLQHMNYLERVIKETLRIFPTVPIIARQVTEDFKIGDIVLPKHTDILIPFIQMHRNKKYWPNPLVFDPDRFLPENIKNYHLFYFTPFSDGPRNCIGMRYGMMSMKAILATLIRSFIFKVNETIEIDKIKLNMDIVLSTVEPAKIKF